MSSFNKYILMPTLKSYDLIVFHQVEDIGDAVSTWLEAKPSMLKTVE